MFVTTAVSVPVHALVLALALGCASEPARGPGMQRPMRSELAGAPEWISRGCASYWADASSRGVCGVGAASPDRNLAITTSAAEGRGRAVIARSLGTRLKALLEDYLATTTADSDEQDVVDVSKQLTNGTLGGAERRDLWIAPSGVVYALMVLDLDKFQAAVLQMKSLSESLRNHVARNAAEALDGSAGDPAGWR